MSTENQILNSLEIGKCLSLNNNKFFKFSKKGSENLKVEVIIIENSTRKTIRKISKRSGFSLNLSPQP